MARDAAPWEQGSIDGFRLVEPAKAEQDARQITAAAHWPAVQRAREACERIVTSSLFYASPMSMNPPADHADLPSECWLVFVNRAQFHYTPGWTQVPAPLFEGDMPRSSHLVKILLPLIFVQPAVYMDFKLTVMRCYAAGPLFAAAKRNDSDLILVHHRHGARSVQVELGETAYAMRSRHFEAAQLQQILTQLDEQRRRIVSDGFALNRSLNLPDCYFIIWPSSGRSLQQTLARRWYYEVAHYSMREQTSFNWVATMVPVLRQRFVDRRYMTNAVKPCSCARGGGGERPRPGGACFNASSPRLVKRLAVGDTSGWQFDAPPCCDRMAPASIATLSAARCCVLARRAAPPSMPDSKLELQACTPRTMAARL